MKRIILENISKQFKKDPTSKSTLYKLISLLTKRDSKEKFYVLKDISLDVEEGEILGIIGENGSGKSTLLRIIAGIYHPDSGKVTTNGKIVSLIDLSSSMRPTLTMEDNIYLCGTFLGLDKKEIKGKFEEIVHFSGLKEFVNTRIYKFSNGMVSRLVFSIAIHCNPQILLLDEVFSVGDEEFKNKSSERIRDLVKEGCSAVLVGHEMGKIADQCDRILWLEHGILKGGGDPHEVVKEYVNSSNGGNQEE